MFKQNHLEIPPEECRSLFGFHWLCACRHHLQGAKRRIPFLLLFLGAGLLLAQPCVAGSGIFENTGDLPTIESAHTATLLPNGKVLVLGGSSSGAELTSAELYDPATGTWTATSSVSVGNGHSATLLTNGKVLIAGGEIFQNGHPVYLAAASLYDPASGTWTATGSLVTGRNNHKATLLPSGKVLVIGGSRDIDNLANEELYDPVSGTWAATGSLSTARFAPTAILLLNGKVLVAGGYHSIGTAIASAELYDPANGTWAATGSLGTARYSSWPETLLPDGRVLVAGGYSGSAVLASAEVYDPVSGAWSATGSLGGPRIGYNTALLPNGKVLIAGGYDNNGSPFHCVANAELFDPASGTWTPTGSLNIPRLGHTGTTLPSGKVLVAGGYDGSNFLRSAELYVGPQKAPALLNIATRMRVLTGDRVLIGGFIVTGTELKRVLIRGIGPSLNGVGGTLVDPTLELHQGSTTIATNDNWKVRPDTTSQQADIEATTIAPTNDLEPAILVSLSPGAYTAILSGKDGGTGVGLVEVYDLGQGANSQLANISTRGFVDTGDNVMIGGLIVGGGAGGGTARVLVRALGPSVPVAGALGDPTLELHDGSGALIASNDNWKTRPDGSSQQAEIEATAIQPGNDLESALVRTLPSGNYTAIVRGTNNTTGVGLVETYNLP